MTPYDATLFPGRERLETWGLQRCPLTELSRLEPLAARLIASFTSERPETFQVYLDDPEMLTTYALVFAPQTYVRVVEALRGLLARLPDFPNRPLRVLDLGSGIGSAALAATDFLTQQTGMPPEVTCVDWSEAALQAVHELLPGAKTQKADLRTFQPSEAYDIILSSFAFNEAFSTSQDALHALRRLAETLTPDAPSFILLLEPADRIAVPKLHTLRMQLVDYPLYAPCPHHQTCPMIATQDGVCHDVRRFKPSRAATLLCRHTRSTISEVKYALLAFGRKNGPLASGFNDPDFLRLTGPFNKTKGLLTCRVCMGDGQLRRLEIPSASLPTERRHELLSRERGDCAWLAGSLELRKQLEQGRIQRSADLHFTDEAEVCLDADLDDFMFSI